MTDMLTPDICVIGAGSGGLSVAAAAAAFGVEVVLIEEGKMGGDCLNYGCVPSKALIASAKHAQAIREAPEFGVSAGEPNIDFQAVHDHIHGVISAIEPNDSVERFTALGVTVIKERGQFSDPDTVIAGSHTIRARRFVVATGSSPFIPAIEGLDTVPVITNETLFDRTTLAAHMVIIGGGPIGMEMAQAHRRLGAQVTVLEAERAMGRDDPEMAAIVLDRMREEGVEIMEGAKVIRVEKTGEGIRVHFDEDGREGFIDGSDILVATGRVANVEGLGLDKAGIAHDRKGIKVAANLKTTNRRTFAIGDVAGGLQFTHVAGYHAGLVIQQILFRAPAKENSDIVPWATYTNPELASVGLSETQARKLHGKSINILRWPYSENDRAQAERKTEGLIKVIADSKGRILGAAIAGANAGEMINFWALAVTRKLKLADIRGYIPPYPTLSEIGKRAAITYYTPMTRKPLVRLLIRFLSRFG